MALELPKLTKKEKTGNKPDITLQIAQFFEKNKFMKVLVPVILFLILVVAFIFVIFGDGILLEKDDSQNPDTSVQSNEVQVIPDNNIIRDKKFTELIDKDPLSPDILSSAVYTGSVVGSSGLKTALVQVGNEGDMLVLTIGETIGDSDWELREIASDYVIFKAGKTTKKLDLAK